MPLLDTAGVKELLERWRWEPGGCGCGDCAHLAVKDYCRTCDEFYRIHRPGCHLYEPKHEGHRLTIVPFVEDRHAI